MKITQIDRDLILIVRNRRIEKGFKLINVANAIGMSESNYCKIERGLKPLSIGKLIQICAFIGIPLSQLMIEHEIKFLHSLE
jgi:transcriptional regulator with XRE-family HTH domain